MGSKSFGLLSLGLTSLSHRSCRLVALNVHTLVGGSYFPPWMCSQKNARTTESRAGKLIWESPCVHTLGVHTYHSALVEVRGRHQMSFLTFCLMYATTYGKLTNPWNFRNSFFSTFHLAGEPLSSQICAGMSSLYMGLGILLAWQQFVLLSNLINTENCFFLLFLFIYLLSYLHL